MATVRHSNLRADFDVDAIARGGKVTLTAEDGSTIEVKTLHLMGVATKMFAVIGSRLDAIQRAMEEVAI